MDSFEGYGVGVAIFYALESGSVAQDECLNLITGFTNHAFIPMHLP